MNIGEALSRVAALLDRRDASRSTTISDDELDALRLTFADHWRMRSECEHRELRNLLHEHREGADSTQPVPAVPAAYSEMP